MIATLTWSLRVVRQQTLLLVQDLDDEQLAVQSAPREHHPAWVLGHLLLGDSYLLHLLGPEDLPADFPDLLRAYGPESSPDAGTSFSREILVERLEQCGTLRCEAVGRMTPAELGRAMSDPVLARSQPTLGHHLHALVFHEGHHGGQIAAWRQRQGLRAAPWVFAGGAQGGS